MIISIGIDLVKTARIKKLYTKSPSATLKKMLSEEEMKYLDKFSNEEKKVAFIASRFAAKEAFVKALGTGFTPEVNLTKISILNNNLGKPYYLLDSDLQEYMLNLLGIKNYQLHLSLTDEKEHAIAFAIIERR